MLQAHISESLNQIIPSLTQFNRPLVRVNAHACGKAIIVGEHAVVYGARAVALPLLSMGIDLQAQYRPAGPITDDPHCELWLADKKIADHGQDVVRDAMQLIGLKPGKLIIRGTSSLPIGAGLGSSATLCVALLRCLAQIADQSLSNRQFSELANHLEHRFHGNPSGLDTAVVAHETVISFRRGEGAEPVHIRPIVPGSMPWRFAIIDSGVRASTMVMVKVAAPYFVGENGSHRLRIFEAISEQVLAGISSGDLQTVGDGMRQAGMLLHEAGVVNAALSSLMDVCESVGCIAAKPTGAGGGGAVLALLDPEQADHQLVQLRQRISRHRVYEVQLS